MTDKKILFFQKISMLVLWGIIKEIKLLPFRFMCTAEEQFKLYKEGKSNCDGYKKVSMHQLGRAIDFVIIDDKGQPIWDHIPEYDILGEIWESLGGTWGGRWYKERKTKFNDCYHFEL